MSKIGILTFHSANNFGALLQAISLQNTINELGDDDCKLINYKPHFIRKDYSLNPFKSKKPKAIITSILRIPDKIVRNIKFYIFRSRNTRCTEKCQSQTRFKDVCVCFDKIIVGSDQVWNYTLTEYDMRYFLYGIPNSVEKLAYGASIGDADFSVDEADEMIQCLQAFHRISVRENATKKLLEHRILNKIIEVVLDPVFLTPKEKWIKLALKPRQKDYILFFKMGYSKTADPALEFAKKLSKKTGYKLLMLWDQETWFRYRDVTHIGPVGPAEFLGWINNAKCVVTNSFHASAFSIIFNTPFYVETEIERKDRILNILNLFELESCGLVRGKTCTDSLVLPQVKWKCVNSRLENERKKSINYVVDILKPEE